MNQNKFKVQKMEKMSQFIAIINTLMMIQWALFKNVMYSETSNNKNITVANQSITEVKF